MYKILRNRSNMAGTVWAETDVNFLSVINALVKLANPELTVKGYTSPSTTEPTSPAVNDAYLAIESGTVWSLTVTVNDIVTWDGSAWVKESFTLYELNTAFQSLFFHAEKIACVPPAGMTATNVQTALDELAAAVFV